MTRIEVAPGVSLAVHDLGTGAPVVLIGGFSLGTVLWERAASVLSDAGYRVIAVELRGHGGSDKPGVGYDLVTLASDVVAILVELELTAAAVVGHSFGGQVAMRVALDRPDLVGSLVLVGSNGVRASRTDDYPFGGEPALLLDASVRGELEDRPTARRALIAGAFAKHPQQTVLDWLVATSLDLPTWAAVSIYDTMFNSDMLAEMTKLDLPVLQIMGTFDPVHSIRAARWVAGRLPDSRLVEIPACGHYPMLEKPVQFESELLRFLAADSGGDDHRKFMRYYDSKYASSSDGVPDMTPSEIVRSFYSAVADRDARRLQQIVVDHFADDAALEFPESLPYGGRVESARILAKVFVGMASAPVPLGPQRVSVSDLVVDGAVVVAKVTFDWFAVGVDEGLSHSALEMWRFEEGKVVEMTAYYWDTGACARLAATAEVE